VLRTLGVSPYKELIVSTYPSFALYSATLHLPDKDVFYNLLHGKSHSLKEYPKKLKAGE
jgi:hypothetical protein